jgi:hypothetical protein
MERSVDSPLRPNWQARAIVSGFAASVVMLFAFILAYAVAAALALLDLARWPGGAVLGRWLHNLAYNPVISLATYHLFAAAALFLAGGLFWAYVYAAVVEPRLAGPGWRRGALYALAPGLLTQLLVLPVVGGGPAGAALGAGPLPALGIVLLHLVYGATLGALYGPLGDSDGEAPADRRLPLPGALLRSERLMAVGVVVGALSGALFGLLIIAVQPFAIAVHPAGLILGGALLVSALGLLVGSFAGLDPGQDNHLSR